MSRIAYASILAAVGFALTAAAVPPGPHVPASSVPQHGAAPVATSKPRPWHHHRHRPTVPSDVAVANKAATLQPVAQGFVDAVQVYPYAEGLIYKVYTAPGHVTDIALQAGETLGAVASGDTVRWVIGDTSSGAGTDKRTHVLVKPFSAGLATNLIITTDRRTYHLALASMGTVAMAALSWTYPQDALIAIKRVEAAAVAAAPVASGIAVDQLRFNYAITGSAVPWRPLRAFDDGRQTFIEFPVTLGVGEAPPLFLVDEKGDAQLVNYRLRGHFYVVDRLFDAAELRLGTKPQTIVSIRRLADQRDRRPS